MAQTISSSVQNDVSQISDNFNLEIFAKLLSPILTHAGIKRKEAENLINSNPRFWRYIEKEFDTSQIEYGIREAHRIHKEDPINYPLNMMNISEQIHLGSYNKFFQENQ